MNRNPILHSMSSFHSSGALRRGLAIAALIALAAVGASWAMSSAAHAGPHRLVASGARASGTADLAAYAGGSNARAKSGDARSRSRGRTERVAQADSDVRVQGKVLSGKLNLNTATEEQLQTLPGIGASKAQRIIEYRTKHGKFARVRDLRRVKGIGYKTLKKLEPYLTVKGPSTLKLE